MGEGQDFDYPWKKLFDPARNRPSINTFAIFILERPCFDPNSFKLP